MSLFMRFHGNKICGVSANPAVVGPADLSHTVDEAEVSATPR
jgi:hypothetical protein